MFGLNSAAAAGARGDDHLMEAAPQKAEDPARSKRRSHWVFWWNGHEVSKTEVELFQRQLQSIRSGCGHCWHEALVRALRWNGAKPLILRPARDFEPSCQEKQKQRLHPVASLEAFLPKCQNIQIDQVE